MKTKYLSPINLLLLTYLLSICNSVPIYSKIRAIMEPGSTTLQVFCCCIKISQILVSFLSLFLFLFIPHNHKELIMNKSKFELYNIHYTYIYYEKSFKTFYQLHSFVTGLWNQYKIHNFFEYFWDQKNRLNFFLLLLFFPLFLGGMGKKKILFM